MLKLLTTALCVMALAPTAPAMRAGASQEPPALKSIGDQFTIALPEGWGLYDQTEAVLRKPSAFGIVVFSATAVTKPGETTADTALLSKVGTGEIASFFVQREKSDKGSKCAKLSSSAVYDIGTNIKKDPVFGAARRMFAAVKPPSGTDMELGGCHGARFLVDANKDDAAKHWTIDVRAVSDGTFLYLFSLRNKADYYARNLEIFEKAIATVQFKASK
jgi:hypothetical protein